MTELRDQLISSLRDWVKGRCQTCFRPVATQKDWDEIPEGEGAHLCWDDGPMCSGGEKDAIEAHVEALLPVIQSLLGGVVSPRHDTGLILKENVMPRVNGRPFRCGCGANVFAEIKCSNGIEYRCNGCGDHYG